MMSESKLREKAEFVVGSAKQLLNAKPVGVNFCFTNNTVTCPHWQAEPLRYCEAVNRVMASSEEIALDGGNISCPAAKEILGLLQCEPCTFGECLKELTEKNKFTSQKFAFKALISVPRLKMKPASIILSANTRKMPDIYIFYLRPYEFMKVVQAYQRVTGEELELNVSSVMPVCGNCTVRPYVTNKVCVSFGCGDSREYGGLREDELVVGMPAQKAELIMQSLVEMEKEG